MQSSIRRVRDARRCWVLLFIDSRLLLMCGAGIETWRERERGERVRLWHAVAVSCVAHG